MSHDLKFSFNEQISAPKVFGPLEVSGETKLRLIVENATIGNTVVVKGRIKGQSDYDTLGTFTGIVAQNINVSVYDELLIDVTTFASSSNFIKVVASGFNPAEGSAISTIGVPFGDTIQESPTIDFTSSDSSVIITGNIALNTIDFKVSAASNPNAYAVIAVPNGTNPTANSSGDTVAFASSDSNVVITGNSGTETVDFAIGTGITNNLTKLESRSVSSLEFTNKQLTLLAAPSVAIKTRLTIVGGPEQKYSVDFLVSGSTLTWSGLGLDGIIEQNDMLIITYP